MSQAWDYMSGTGALPVREASSLRSLTALSRRMGGLVRGMLRDGSSLQRGMRRLQGHGRRLQVSETVQLGEKRFVAILRVDGEQFLIGGSATGVSLLASLAGDAAQNAVEPVAAPKCAAVPARWPKAPSFSDVLAAQSAVGELV